VREKGNKNRKTLLAWIFMYVVKISHSQQGILDILRHTRFKKNKKYIYILLKQCKILKNMILVNSSRSSKEFLNSILLDFS
jgi:hypothetical protein